MRELEIKTLSILSSNETISMIWFAPWLSLFCYIRFRDINCEFQHKAYVTEPKTD